MAILNNFEVLDFYHNLYLLFKRLGLTWPTVKTNFKQEVIFKLLELLKYCWDHTPYGSLVSNCLQEEIIKKAWYKNANWICIYLFLANLCN